MRHLPSLKHGKKVATLIVFDLSLFITCNTMSHHDTRENIHKPHHGINSELDNRFISWFPNDTFKALAIVQVWTYTLCVTRRSSNSVWGIGQTVRSIFADET